MAKIPDFVTFDGGLEGQGVIGFVIDVLYLRHLVYERLGYLQAMNVHADGVSLHNGRIGVYIDDESGQKIAFPVNETECVVIGAYESERLTYAVGGADTLHPEIGGQFCHSESENTYSDRTDLPMAYAEGFIIRGEDRNQFTLFRLGRLMRGI